MPKIVVCDKTAVPDGQRSLSLNLHYWLHYSYGVSKSGSCHVNSSFSSSSSIGTTADCGLWPVEQCPSIFSYLPPTLSIFSLPALGDLFLLVPCSYGYFNISSLLPSVIM